MAEDNIQPPSTQEASTETSFWGFGGVFNSLASQAANIVNIYKEDLKEFGSTIKHDTQEAFQVVAKRAAEVGESFKDENETQAHSSESLVDLSKIKSGFKSFVDGVSDLTSEIKRELTETTQKSENSTLNNSSSGPSEQTHLDHFDVSIIEDETEFSNWLKSFDLASKLSETSQILSTNSSLLSLHQQLVPNDLSPEEFWGRYYFKLEQAQKKEEKRIELLKRTKTMAQNEDEIKWDDDDENNANQSNEHHHRDLEEHIEGDESPSVAEAPEKQSKTQQNQPSNNDIAINNTEYDNKHQTTESMDHHSHSAVSHTESNVDSISTRKNIDQTSSNTSTTNIDQTSSNTSADNIESPEDSSSTEKLESRDEKSKLLDLTDADDAFDWE